MFDKHTGASVAPGPQPALRLTGPTHRAPGPRPRLHQDPAAPPPDTNAQAHHAVADWKDGGHTDVDDLTLACGPDNRLIENTDWHTRKRSDGRTEWVPPPHLDTGQARINDLHHPENMLMDPGDGT